MTEESNTDTSKGGGGKIPIFTGQKTDYSDWKVEASVWADLCKKPKNKIAGLLFLAQENRMVKKVMISITMEKMTMENRTAF